MGPGNKLSNFGGASPWTISWIWLEPMGLLQVNTYVGGLAWIKEIKMVWYQQ